MKTKMLSPQLALLIVMVGVWSGCDSEMGILLPNQPPNTRISAGPPEASDTGFNVSLFWFGWDDDGFVDHYEIAWGNDPENLDWLGPIFANDSLFSVEASESCCVDPLPEFGPEDELPDRVYQQYHTFWVRAVDNNDVADTLPAFRSFNAKTVAPYTSITFGPRNVGKWGTDVQFRWEGLDDDGVVESYKIALTSVQEWRDNFGLSDTTAQPTGGAGELIAWLDTLTFRPQPGGTYDFTDTVWKHVEQDSFVFESLPTTTGSAFNVYLFAVRAIDDAGAEERILNSGINTRLFNVSAVLDGPRIGLSSNIVGTWSSADPVETREVFAGQGVRFEWSASPGESQTPVAGFSYAVDDTSQWEPFSANNVEWPQQIPDQEERLWFPVAGSHTFFLRAIDLGGFVRLLVAKLRVFDGPRFCDESARTILVVLDTDPSASLIIDSIWPVAYPAIERSLMNYYFEGFNFQIHETKSNQEPDINLLNCATSTFWFHSSDVEVDDSILQQFHSDPPNPLPSYVSSGGNLFLCGIQPGNALRYFESEEFPDPQIQNHPVLFLNTVDDPDFTSHWAATLLGISQIEETIGNTQGESQRPNRLRNARAAVEGYPDLQFDPLTWPQGPIVRGFGYYDRGVIPLRNDARFPDAEVLYKFNDDARSIAIRRPSPDGPGINGNVVFLGFHPYFVDRPQARDMIRAVLDDFGERPNNPNP